MVTQLPCVLSGSAYRSCCCVDSGKLIQTQRGKKYECLLPLTPAARPAGSVLPSWKERWAYLCCSQPGQAVRPNFSLASKVRAFNEDSAFTVVHRKVSAWSRSVVLAWETRMAEYKCIIGVAVHVGESLGTLTDKQRSLNVTKRKALREIQSNQRGRAMPPK